MQKLRQHCLWLSILLSLTANDVVSMNSINQTLPITIIGETSYSTSADDEDFTTELVIHVSSILCEFQPKHVYLYFVDDLQTSLADELILLLNKCTSIEIFRYNNSQPIRLINDDYQKTIHLNIIKNTDDINLSYVKTNSADKYNSYFIILIESIQFEGAWIQETLEKFWELHLLNVLIIFWNDAINQVTYSPFANEFLISFPSDETNPIKLFYEKTQNLNGYPLKVSLFAERTRAIFHKDGSLSGTDGWLTEVIVKAMNATLILQPPTDGYDIGEFLKNGSVIGSLAQIIKHEVDVSFNTRFLRLAQFQGKVQITHPNGRDDICILVAKAGYASNVNNIFLAFTSTVWIFSLASLIIATVSFTIMYRIQNEHRIIKNIFLEFYSWNLAQPINRLPDQWATKIIIGFFIIYGLLITSSYQGNLTSFLINRRTLPEINTIRQLEKTSYEVLTFGRYVDLLMNFLNQTGYKSLKTRIRGIPVQDITKYIDENNVKYAYANKYHINQYQSKRKKHIIRGRPVYHNMKECPVPYLVAYAVVYGSPFLGRINVILRRIQEAGMVFYWDKNSEGNHASSTQRSDDEPVALTLDHVQSAFYILTIGLGLSFIAFIGEWIKFKYKLNLRFC